MSTNDSNSSYWAPDLPVEIIEQIFIFLKDDFEAIRRSQVISKNFYDALKYKLKPNLDDIQISNGARNLFQRRQPLKATTKMMKKKFNFPVELRLVMLGPRSGKSRFLQLFIPRLRIAVENDYVLMPPVTYHRIKYGISLWDGRLTNLHETRMKKKYLFGSVGVWLCFSIANRMSFRSLLEQWLDEIIKCEVMSYTKFYLVGMCADLEHQRQVSREEAESVAYCLGMTYIECSSRNAKAHPVDWKAISLDLLQARYHEPPDIDEYSNSESPPTGRWCLLL